MSKLLDDLKIRLTKQSTGKIDVESLEFLINFAEKLLTEGSVWSERKKGAVFIRGFYVYSNGEQLDRGGFIAWSGNTLTKSDLYDIEFNAWCNIAGIDWWKND